MIIESIDLLVLFCGEKDFQDEIQRHSRPLIVNVALPLLRTEVDELEEMKNDPEAFVNLALDTCDKQTSKVIKT